jgi:hypothetical protein
MSGVREVESFLAARSRGTVGGEVRV